MKSDIYFYDVIERRSVRVAVAAGSYCEARNKVKRIVGHDSNLFDILEMDDCKIQFQAKSRDYDECMTFRAYRCYDDDFSRVEMKSLFENRGCRVCVRCGTPVKYDRVSDGYFCYCPSCDEDLYYFETEVKNGVICKNKRIHKK